MKAQRNKSLRPLVSFDNFDPTGPRDVLINSPRSLAVCEAFEIKPKELFILSKKELLKEFKKEDISPKERQALFQEYIQNMQNTLQTMYQKRLELIETGAIQTAKHKKRKIAASHKKSSKPQSAGLQPPENEEPTAEEHKAVTVSRLNQDDNQDTEDEQPPMNSKLLADNETNKKQRLDKKNKQQLALGDQRPITAQQIHQGVVTEDRKKKKPASLRRKLSLSTPQSLESRDRNYVNFSSTVLPSGTSERVNQEASTLSKLQQVEQREQKRQLTKLEAYKILEENRQKLIQKMHLTNYRQKQYERQKEGTSRLTKRRGSGRSRTSSFASKSASRSSTTCGCSRCRRPRSSSSSGSKKSARHSCTKKPTHRASG